MKKLCHALGSTALFQGLNHEIFREYCVKTNIQIFWKGEIVLNEGDLCEGIGVIIEGQLAVQKYAPSGEFTTIDLLGPSEIFGEQLIFSRNRHYRTTLEAVATAKVVYIMRDELMGMIQKSPKLLSNYLQLLSDRIDSAKIRINLLAQKTLRQKIACYLLNLLKEQNPNYKEMIVKDSIKSCTDAVELPVSKEVVARLLAMPRPSLSRELISMEKDGLIKVSGRLIWLNNLDKFRSSLAEACLPN